MNLCDAKVAGMPFVQRIIAHPLLIRNQRKIRAVVRNAQAIAGIVRDRGSFQAHVDGFRPAT